MTPQARLRLAQAALRYMEASLIHTHQGYRHVIEQQIEDHKERIAELERQAQQQAGTSP